MLHHHVPNKAMSTPVNFNICFILSWKKKIIGNTLQLHCHNASISLVAEDTDLMKKILNPCHLTDNLGHTSVLTFNTRSSNITLLLSLPCH